MSRHVLVAMGPNEASENALEYALREHPDATISVVHVTATSDPLGLFGDRDPEEYMVPECGFEIDDEVCPTGTRSTGPNGGGPNAPSTGRASSRTSTARR